MVHGDDFKSACLIENMAEGGKLDKQRFMVRGPMEANHELGCSRINLRKYAGFC